MHAPRPTWLTHICSPAVCVCVQVLSELWHRLLFVSERVFLAAMDGQAGKGTEEAAGAGGAHPHLMQMHGFGSVLTFSEYTLAQLATGVCPPEVAPNVATGGAVGVCGLCSEEEACPTRLSCGHRFCFSCWMSSPSCGAMCPMCKLELPGHSDSEVHMGWMQGLAQLHLHKQQRMRLQEVERSELAMLHSQIEHARDTVSHLQQHHQQQQQQYQQQQQQQSLAPSAPVPAPVRTSPPAMSSPLSGGTTVLAASVTPPSSARPLSQLHQSLQGTSAAQAHASMLLMSRAERQAERERLSAALNSTTVSPNSLPSRTLPSTSFAGHKRGFDAMHAGTDGSNSTCLSPSVSYPRTPPSGTVSIGVSPPAHTQASLLQQAVMNLSDEQLNRLLHSTAAAASASSGVVSPFSPATSTRVAPAEVPSAVQVHSNSAAAAAAAVSAPVTPSSPYRRMPGTPVSGAASVSGSSVDMGKRSLGFSCHHCKTHKPHRELRICTARTNVNNKKCRKKYCLLCLKRLYAAEWQRAQPTDEAEFAHVGYTWQCPSCSDCCVCAGCERRTAGITAVPKKRRGAATAAAAAVAASTSSDASVLLAASPHPSPPAGQVAPLLDGGAGDGTRRVSDPEFGDLLAGVRLPLPLLVSPMPPSEQQRARSNSASDGSDKAWLRGLNTAVALERGTSSSTLPAKRAASVALEAPHLDLHSEYQWTSGDAADAAVPSDTMSDVGGARVPARRVRGNKRARVQGPSSLSRASPPAELPLLQHAPGPPSHLHTPLAAAAAPMTPSGVHQPTLDALIVAMQLHSNDPTSSAYLNARQMLESYLKVSASAVYSLHPHLPLAHAPVPDSSTTTTPHAPHPTPALLPTAVPLPPLPALLPRCAGGGGPAGRTGARPERADPQPAAVVRALAVTVGGHAPWSQPAGCRLALLRTRAAPARALPRALSRCCCWWVGGDSWPLHWGCAVSPPAPPSLYLHHFVSVCVHFAIHFTSSSSIQPPPTLLSALTSHFPSLSAPPPSLLCWCALVSLFSSWFCPPAAPALPCPAVPAPARPRLFPRPPALARLSPSPFLCLIRCEALLATHCIHHSSTHASNSPALERERNSAGAGLRCSYMARGHRRAKNVVLSYVF